MQLIKYKSKKYALGRKRAGRVELVNLTTGKISSLSLAKLKQITQHKTYSSSTYCPKVGNFVEFRQRPAGWVAKLQAQRLEDLKEVRRAKSKKKARSKKAKSESSTRKRSPARKIVKILAPDKVMKNLESLDPATRKMILDQMGFSMPKEPERGVTRDADRDGLGVTQDAK